MGVVIRAAMLSRRCLSIKARTLQSIRCSAHQIEGTLPSLRSTSSEARDNGNKDVLDAAQQDKGNERDGASNVSEFFPTSVKAAAGTAKEKLAQATGMSDQKPISSAEDMGPAGWMQENDPKQKQEDKYEESTSQTQQHWRDAKLKGKPNHQYPEHGKNA